MTAIRIEDITSRWELAEAFSSKCDIPETFIQELFEKTSKSMKNRLSSELQTQIKNKVWRDLSSDKIARLREVLILSTISCIFGRFSDSEIETMLKDYRMGSFNHSLWKPAYQSIEQTTAAVMQSIDLEFRLKQVEWSNEFLNLLNNHIENQVRRERLAHRLSGSENVATVALKQMFKSVIDEVQQGKPKFEPLLIHRLEKVLLETKLPLLKKFYAEVFSNRILSIFNDTEIEALYNDNTGHGLSSNLRYWTHLYGIDPGARLTNVEVVTRQAKEMAKSWIPDIKKALTSAEII